MGKLSVEEAQLLSDNKDVLPVVEKLLKECLSRHVDRLLTLSTEAVDSAHVLLTHKAKLDGMTTLIKDFSVQASQQLKR